MKIAATSMVQLSKNNGAAAGRNGITNNAKQNWK